MTRAILPLACAVLAMTGCRTHDDTPLGSGNVESGKRLLASYGCGSCHVIPGVRGATGHVGPPLTALSRRAFIAGELPNRAEDLRRFIQVPQEVRPGSAMPNLGVTEAEGTDMVAYLYTLR